MGYLIYTIPKAEDNRSDNGSGKNILVEKGWGKGWIWANTSDGLYHQDVSVSCCKYDLE